MDPLNYFLSTWVMSVESTWVMSVESNPHFWLDTLVYHECGVHVRRRMEPLCIDGYKYILSSQHFYE